MQQERESFEVEYRFDPIPDADERLSHALDAIIRLLLTDLARHPDDDRRPELLDGVK